MAQFDVHRVRGSDALIIDCQTDLLAHIDSRFAVPLVSPELLPVAARRLNPMFEIDGSPYVMLTQSAAAMPCRELGPVVVSLAEHDHDIINALDFLLTGV